MTNPEQIEELREHWLTQFNPEHRVDATRLLSAVRNVTADEFQAAMVGLLESRVKVEPKPVGIFVETERGHRKGKPHRLFKEPRRPPRRASENGPPIIAPTRTVDPEVGSEGLVAQIVTQVFRGNRKLTTIHPSPETIRGRKIRRFILVTDFIGSGDRASKYLESAWRVRSVRSWWSARRSKGLSFEVVAFSATDVGRRKVEAHSSRPTVHIVEGCPTINESFDLPEDRLRMKELCFRYHPGDATKSPLGHGEVAALIVFAHGMPNNAPTMFHKRNKSKKRLWAPLYPERVQPSLGLNKGSISTQKRLICEDLHRVFDRKILQSPTFLSAPLALRDAIKVLLFLKRSSGTETTISARTGLTINRTTHALARAQRFEWIDADLQMSEKGQRELVRLAAARYPKALPFLPSKIYVPQSLRMPRSSR